MRALVGDIGGTKTDLAIYEGTLAAPPTLVRSERYASAAHASLKDVVCAMLASDRVDVAVLAVAGPVRDGRSKITNLPWSIDARELEAALHAPVELQNDFAVLPLAMPHLAPSDVVSLSAGERDPEGPIAVIGAGTGLGEALALRVGDNVRVLPTEGGHADFAPQDEEQARLWRYLHQKHGHVSVERVVSGPGLATVHAFLLHDSQAANAAELTPAEVADRALASTDPVCERALSLWLSLYGAEAGNLALKSLPTGGLYLAGGIAPRIVERMQRGGELLRAFMDKGRMRSVLERIPVDVVIHPRVALIGAWARAAVIYNHR